MCLFVRTKHAITNGVGFCHCSWSVLISIHLFICHMSPAQRRATDNNRQQQTTANFHKSTTAADETLNKTTTRTTRTRNQPTTNETYLPTPSWRESQPPSNLKFCQVQSLSMKSEDLWWAKWKGVSSAPGQALGTITTSKNNKYHVRPEYDFLSSPVPVSAAAHNPLRPIPPMTPSLVIISQVGSVPCVFRCDIAPKWRPSSKQDKVTTLPSAQLLESAAWDLATIIYIYIYIFTSLPLLRRSTSPYIILRTHNPNTAGNENGLRASPWSVLSIQLASLLQSTSHRFQPTIPVHVSLYIPLGHSHCSTVSLPRVDHSIIWERCWLFFRSMLSLKWDRLRREHQWYHQWNRELRVYHLWSHRLWRVQGGSRMSRTKPDCGRWPWRARRCPGRFQASLWIQPQGQRYASRRKQYRIEADSKDRPDAILGDDGGGGTLRMRGFGDEWR